MTQATAASTAPTNAVKLLLRAARNQSLRTFPRPTAAHAHSSHYGQASSAAAAAFLLDTTHDATLSYQDTLVLVARIADRLRSLDPGHTKTPTVHGRPTSRPTLALVSPYNQPSQILCLFAAWLAGWRVAVLPVSISTPPALLEAMLKLAQPSLVLASQTAQCYDRAAAALASELQGSQHRPQLLTFADFFQPLLPASNATPNRDPLLGELAGATTSSTRSLSLPDAGLDLSHLDDDPDSPALVLFTSSAISRETVKAVELTHRFLYLQAEGSLGLVSFDRVPRVLGCSSLNHAMGIYIELFAFVLGTGGTYLLPCHPDLLGQRRGLLGEECAHVLRQPASRATAAAATPGLVKAWMGEADLLPHLRRLDILPVAGADIDVGLFHQARAESVPIAPCYGMTEIGVAAYGRPATSDRLSGSAFRSMQLTHVLSTPGRPDAGDFASSGFVGHVGQLVIDASSYIFSGYYLLDGRGDISFKPHTGAYGTGDLVEFSDSDADPCCPSFTFVSRIDDTIQLESGDKVLAGLFEQALDSCEGIARSFVCGDQEATARQSRALVAYVELDVEGAALPRSVQQRCIARAVAKVNATVSAPARISPHRVKVVDHLPITSKNATFRKKIKAELRARERDAPSDVDAVSRLVVAEARTLVQDQLGLGPEDVDDALDLSGLGLDSSRAVAFFGRIKARYDVKLEASLLFTTETFGELCESIRVSIAASRKSHVAARVDAGDAAGNGEIDVAPIAPSPIAQPASERIAVVGAGLRLPGNVNSVDEFWTALHANAGTGGEPIFSRLSDERRSYLGSEGERMPRYPCGWIGKRGMEDFDPAFFGMSDDEALHAKPQQRLLLEVAYETLQDAMIAPQSLRGARVGVFIGCSNADGYDEVIRHAGVDQHNKHAGASLNQSVLCGRLSHHFDWTGPSITIQTACSSGLNSIDLAVAALQNGECDYALVGGVTTHIGAITLGFLESAGMSSPTGTSTPFGKSSDGYVPSEGCALLLLSRLGDAAVSSDRIYGCIDAATSAHQGRTATMATTNARAQRRMYEAVMAKAGISAADVALFEAHGTSTPLGDSIEASAIIETFKGRPRGRPLVVGSSKAVFGHTEECAGIVSTLKALLCLRRGEAPPHHAGPIRQQSRWDQVPALMRCDQTNPLPTGNHKAVVSGIGFAGTLGAIVVSRAPSELNDAEQAIIEAADRAHLLQFSAPSHHLLFEQMREAARLLSQGECKLADLEVILARGQDQHAHGQAIVARSRDEAVRQIEDSLAKTQSDCFPTPGSSKAQQQQQQDRPYAVQFSGQGKLEPGSGQDWYHTSTSFRQAFDRAAERILAKSGLDIKEIVDAAPLASNKELLQRPSVAQPYLFALQYAMEAWLRSHLGRPPVAAIGHSIGEIAAAATTGRLSLDDAVDLVCLRGSLCDKAPAGAMVAVKCTRKQADEVLATLDPALNVGLAAHNGPDSLTFSGSEAGVSAFEHEVIRRGYKCTRLLVSAAYHNRKSLEGVAGPLLDWAPSKTSGGQAPAGPTPAFVSTEAAFDEAQAGALDGPHWHRHLLEPVMYDGALERLHTQHRPALVIEVGPSAQLTGLASRKLANIRCLALARRPTDFEPVLLALQFLFHAGLRISRPDLDSRRREAPSAPPSLLCLFERKRCWPDLPSSKVDEGHRPASADQLGLGIKMQPAESVLPAKARSVSAVGEDASEQQGAGAALASRPSALALVWTQLSRTDDGVMLQAQIPKEAIASILRSADGLEGALLSACKSVDAQLNELVSIEHVLRSSAGVGKLQEASAVHCLAFCPLLSANSPSTLARLSLIATDSKLAQTPIATVEASIRAATTLSTWPAPTYTRTRFVTGGPLPTCLKYLVECSPTEWEGVVEGQGPSCLSPSDILDIARVADPSFDLPLSVAASSLAKLSSVALDAPHRLYITRGDSSLMVALAPWDRASQCVFSAEIEVAGSDAADERSTLFQVVKQSEVLPVTSDAQDAASSMPAPSSVLARAATRAGSEAADGNPLYLPPHKSRLHHGILKALDSVAAVHCRNSLRDFDAETVQPAQRSYYDWAKDVAARSLEPSTYELTAQERDEYACFFEAIHRVGKRQTSIYRDSKAAVQALFCPDILTDVYRKTAAAENIGKSIPQVLRRIGSLAKQSGRDRCRILEIGAGTGQLSRLVAAATKDVERELGVTFELVLTDVALSMARKARQAAIDVGFDPERIVISTVNIVTGELGAAIAPDAAHFDAVVSADVLHIATDLDMILGVFRSLLRPNGCLYAWELDAQLLESQGPGAIFIEHLFGAFPDWWPQTRKHAVLTEKQWVALLGQSFQTVHTHHPALEGAGSILLFAEKVLKGEPALGGSPASAQGLVEVYTPATGSSRGSSVDANENGRYSSSVGTTVQSASSQPSGDAKHFTSIEVATAPAVSLASVVATVRSACVQALDLSQAPAPDHDLFEAGLDSLSSAQILGRLSDAFGVELPLDLFYTASTISVAAREVLSIIEAAGPASVPEAVEGVSAHALLATTESTSGQVSLDAIAAVIRSACEQALQLDQSLAGDRDLFDLGLDSLTSAQAISRIEKAFDVEVPVDLFYTASTVDAAAAQVLELCHAESQGAEAAKATYPGLEAAPRETTIERPPADEEQLRLEDECRQLLADLKGRARQLNFEARQAAPATTKRTVLLTGVTGTVGSNLAVSLVRRGHSVICLSRRGKSTSAYDRLYSLADDILAPADVGTLRIALERGQLEILETDDMCAPGLGLRDGIAYTSLLSRVDAVVHSAWRIAYSPRLSGYSRHLDGLLRLLELCAASKRIIEFHFVSSVAAARIASWDPTELQAGALPESIVALEPGLRLTDNEAYGASKLVSEALLAETVASLPNAPRLAIHRLSQISGDSRTGWWKPNSEVAPCILSSVSSLDGAFLAPQADADWIPSDVCGAAMADIVGAATDGGPKRRVEVYHLANPHRLRVDEWAGMWTRIISHGRIDSARFLRPTAYRRAIETAHASSSAKRGQDENPALRMLAYMKALERLDERRTALGVDLPREPLDTSRAQSVSPALRACPRINETLLRRYADSFRRQWTV
ncbi:uncharacterized protein PFL1_00001 [Pseudozyma flocculosa PF-1]|uniref:Polyketide synthase n=1 Tax=Pseudozyma flocculosa TaxID=84751 RepID=A0A5C3ETX6_9BASI|nr:uncharacterized protein PFL1_00001 [Pseudozyma flocculosa PF-1]EPQ31802.1 hypothetical protein PFL1_00001 [Pseudozyma flocculosa PF-1]SPO35310.1 uncharacterized protein PSFLO_00781 [Pseudozyma flocculosa]